MTITDPVLHQTTVTTPGRPRLSEAMAPLVAALEGRGVRVGLDIRELTPPFAYVPPPRLSWRFRQGDMNLDGRVLLVAANVGRFEAYEQLDELLLAAQAAFGDHCSSAEPIEMPSSDGSAVLLGYELTVKFHVRQEISS
jgi:hypothetical protein